MYKIIRIATSKTSVRVFVHTLEQDYTSLHTAMQKCKDYNRLNKNMNNANFDYLYAVINKE